MSYIEADSPNIHVKVNGILSRCSTDCSYQATAAKTPILTSYSKASGIVTLNLSESDNAISKEDLSIWYGGSPCVITNNDLTALTCTVIGIEAGDHIPIVLAKDFGFAKIKDNSVTATTVDPVITTISPNTGST